jgi:hypothetical protein
MTAMTDVDRDNIRALDRARRAQRNNLLSDVEQAKYNLHPRTLLTRWTGQKRQQLSAVAENGKQSITKNAPLIGLAGATILLFSARKPIFRLYQKLRDKAQQAKDPSS